MALYLQTLEEAQERVSIEPKRRSVFCLLVIPTQFDTGAQEALLNELDLDPEQVVFTHLSGDPEDIKRDIEAVGPLITVWCDCEPTIETPGYVFNDETREEVTQAIRDLVLTDFPHLHLHDEYSLRDGLGTIKQRTDLMQERHWTYLTASNHGSLGGWIKQYVLAKKLGLKPVFGVEAYTNEHRRLGKEEVGTLNEEMRVRYRKNNHLLLTVRTLGGWFNVIKIMNDANVNGFYYKPRTDSTFLAEHGKGVIATSTDGGAGEIPQILCDESKTWEERLGLARQRYDFYKSVFDEFYIELNLLDWDKQVEINRLLITFGEWVGAKYVITCDCHYLRPEDVETHDVLLMLRDNKTFADKALALAAGHLGKTLVREGLSTDPKSVEWAEQVKTEKHQQLTQEAFEKGREFLREKNLKEALVEYEKKITELSKGEGVLDPGEEDSVWEFNVRDLYFKDFNDIYETWKRLHGSDDPVFTEDMFWRAVKDTRGLVRSVENFEIDTTIKLPKISEDSSAELERFCREGMIRLRLNGVQEYEDRLSYELGVITKMNFCDYFLVFNKIIGFCHEHNIKIGPGRGSAAGCLISYCLNITQVDPLKFGLLFERFMNPEGRQDAPDLDVDFDIRYRKDVKQGMTELFGDEHACTVGSYQMMRTKGVLKDVGRVYCLDSTQLNIITKKLAVKYGDNNGDDEEEGETTLDKIDWSELLKREPVLKNLCDDYPFLNKHCEVLRGQIRNIGKHPAGVIVSSVNLNDWIPIRKQEDEVVATWTEGLDYKELQSIGLIKYDILGLRTVSILAETQRLVEESTFVLTFNNGEKTRVNREDTVVVEYEGERYETRVEDLQPGHVVVQLSDTTTTMNDETKIISYQNTCEKVEVTPVMVIEKTTEPFDMTTIPLDDKSALKRLNDHDVFGVFQFETPVALGVIDEIGIDDFEDMYAATTLGRPDPLSGNLHVTYGRRKRREESWENIEVLTDVFKQTYCLPLYQEQTMIFSQRLAGFSAGEANALRKGLAKGKDSEENAQKLQVLLGQLKERSQVSVDEGKISREQLDELLGIIERFGGYGFNKCLDIDTLVELKNGRKKKLKNVKKGDYIRCLDVKERKDCYKKVKNVISSGEREVYELKTARNHLITCSLDHKFLCLDNKMRPVREILEKNMAGVNTALSFYTEDILMSKHAGFSTQPVTEFMVSCDDPEMYTFFEMFKYIGVKKTIDLEIDSPDHNFYANGLVVSNSHAVSYAMVAYWALFLKTHYPAQFLCSLFNFTDRSKTDKRGNSVLSRYVKYAKKRNIVIKPPDIRNSDTRFKLEGINVVRWGLAEVKGLGPAAAGEITQKQPFESLEDFVSKVEKKKLNKSKVEALIRCGAFDELGDREYLLNKYKSVILKEKNFTGVTITEEQRQEDETELLGVCLSYKVMPEFTEEQKKALASYRVKSLEELPKFNQGLFLGRIKDVKTKQSKKSGKDMLVVDLYDDTDETSFFVWEKDIEKCQTKLTKGNLVVVPLKKFDDGGALFYSGPESKLVVIS